MFGKPIPLEFLSVSIEGRDLFIAARRDDEDVTRKGINEIYQVRECLDKQGIAYRTMEKRESKGLVSDTIAITLPGR